MICLVLIIYYKTIMKITKPSQLREGMKVKFKRSGVPFSGWAYKSPDGLWIVSGGTGTGHNLGFGSFFDDITDVESVEGIRAAKEGDVIITADGREATILFCNEFVFLKSEWDKHNVASASMFTYGEAEYLGYKLKDEPSTEADPIEVNGKEIEQRVFAEIEKELFKHKFNTDMDGWQIVPQLTATMQILRSKYFGENQGA